MMKAGCGGRFSYGLKIAPAALLIMMMGIVSLSALAADEEDSIDGTAYESEYGQTVRVKEPFRLIRERDRPRDYVLSPLVSFLFPGFDQWYEGQYTYAAAYTGTAVASLVYADLHKDALRRQSDRNAELRRQNLPEETAITSEDTGVRKYTLGALLYQGAGGMSAYHSFRSAVPTHQLAGNFRFLKAQETPGEVLLAPFRFDFLTRATTLVPLGIAAGLHLMTVSSEIEGIKRDSLSSADVFFAGAYSYNAGVHEEAVFRGWIMPVMMHWLGSEFWSNTATAGLFALAHMNNVEVPLPQLVLGWYMGYVTQQNQWSIAEAVFIHAWWDVFAFLTEFQITRLENRVDAKMPVLWLPPLALHF